MRTPAYDDSCLEVEDGVATITFDRPERMNAFHEAMMHQVIDALDRCDADGAGSGVPAAGSTGMPALPRDAQQEVRDARG